MIEDTKIEKRLGRQLNCVKAVSKIGIYQVKVSKQRVTILYALVN